MEPAQQASAPEIIDEAQRMDSPPMSERVAPMLKSLNEGTHRAYVFADRQVHAHPWGSVGAALGLGALFGALIALATGRQAEKH